MKRKAGKKKTVSGKKAAPKKVAAWKKTVRGRKPAKGKKQTVKPEASITQILHSHEDYEYLRRHVDKLWELTIKSEERLQDIEIHVNLLTRLLTTVCVEKVGMRIGVLKRLIKRIEKEAIRDTQISQLESLYKLPHKPKKNNSHMKPSSGDEPWEEIS